MTPRIRLAIERLWLWLRYRDPEQRAIAGVRRGLAAMGAAIDDLTDEEVIAGVECARQAFHASGVSTADMARACARLGASLRP